MAVFEIYNINIILITDSRSSGRNRRMPAKPAPRATSRPTPAYAAWGTGSQLGWDASEQVWYTLPTYSPCLSGSKHHASRLGGGVLDLIKLVCLSEQAPGSLAGHGSTASQASGLMSCFASCTLWFVSYTLYRSGHFKKRHSK